MDPDAPFVIAVIAIISGTAMAIVKMVLSHRARLTGGPARQELAAIEERLTRIEQAVDAIAVETERISEAQRFTTRLLAERNQAETGAGRPA